MSSYHLPRESDLAQPKPKFFTMPTDSNARVFVSHSSKDKPFVKKLVEELRKRPLNVWVDETELKVGDSIVSKISEGLKETDYLVVVLSKASVSSRWVQEELNAALASQLAGKGVVLPVLIEDCDVPVLLKDRLYADFRFDFNAGLQKLLAVFEQEGESAANVAPEVAIKAAPCSQKLSAITLADLRRRITKRMDRGDVNALWFDVLETTMENDMAGRQLSDCVIVLLEKAKNRNKLSLLIEQICEDRRDLADP
jgi:TIR domain-containing protein